MLVVEIATYANLSGGVNDSPFVRRYFMTRQALAAYWTGVFGAADDQVAPNYIYISGVMTGYISRYLRQATQVDCESQEQSFYWDGADYLYVHYQHSDDEWCTAIESASPLGFTNKRILYIDDVCYRPLLRSSPSIAQQQDWINYNRLSFINGSFEFDNVGAAFDFAILAQIFGNEVFLYYLADTGAENFSRSDLVSMAAFYIENYQHTLKALTVDVQDLRVAQNIRVPVELFTQDVYPTLDDKYQQKPVPLAYGTIRASAAIPVDTDVSGVTFRQAVLLTSLGTVQILIDAIWYDATPTSSNLPRGEFVLDFDSSTDDRGNSYPCRVLGSVGIVAARASDVIIDLNERYLGLTFNGSNYDVAEWAAEEVLLDEIGIIFDKQVELFEAIRQVQAGSNLGFRYEIAADGRRTIRVNDWTRAVSRHVTNTELGNADELPVSSTDDYIASEVEVSYSKDYNDGLLLTVRNSDNVASVLAIFRTRTLISISTAIVDSVTADACALWYAQKLEAIHGTAELVLRGRDKLLVRIYDVLTVELTPGFVDADAGTVVGRHYYGIWRVQVLAVDPNEDLLENKIRAVLISEEGAT